MHRGPLVAAGLSGALLFAGLTAIYGSNKLAEPLPRQADRALANFGFGINEISLTGHHNTLDSDIFSALDPEQSQSVVHFDVAKARARIEALPWIKMANVQRILPDQLRVEVVERSPAAVWLDGDREGLVDRTGRLLAWVKAGTITDLPRIAGAGAPAASADLFAALSAYPAIATRVDHATRIGERRWSLTLVGGTIVHLPAGREQDGLRRLVDLETRNRVMDAGGKEVDLRIDGQIAVREMTTKNAASGEAGKARQTM
jgi:cell division protein FtsQ